MSYVERHYVKICVCICICETHAFSQAQEYQHTQCRDLYFRYLTAVDARNQRNNLRHRKQDNKMPNLIVCSPCSSVEVRPQVQQLGNCKEVRNKKMDRECERFLLLSCCFEVSVFEKLEWTAQAEWCKILAMSSAFQIVLLCKYDGWSVMNAASIQLHSQLQCFQSDKRAWKENAWINILCVIFRIFYVWFKDFLSVFSSQKLSQQLKQGENLFSKKLFVRQHITCNMQTSPYMTFVCKLRCI